MSAPSPGLDRHQRTFAHDAISGRQARRWAHRHLHAWSLDDAADDVLLILSELVANAVLHGTGPVVVTLARIDGGIRIEVCDEGDGSISIVEGPVDRPSGRGLVIVDRLTHRWGVDPGGDGRSVWAEVRAEARP